MSFTQTAQAKLNTLCKSTHGYVKPCVVQLFLTVLATVFYRKERAKLSMRIRLVVKNWHLWYTLRYTLSSCLIMLKIHALLHHEFSTTCCFSPFWKYQAQLSEPVGHFVTSFPSHVSDNIVTFSFSYKAKLTNTAPVVAVACSDQEYLHNCQKVLGFPVPGCSSNL